MVWNNPIIRESRVSAHCREFSNIDGNILFSNRKGGRCKLLAMRQTVSNNHLS